MNVPTTTPGTPVRARAPIAAMLRRVAVAGALALALVGVSVSAASASQQRIRTNGGEVRSSTVAAMAPATTSRASQRLARAVDTVPTTLRVSWSGRLHRPIVGSCTHPRTGGARSAQRHTIRGFGGAACCLGARVSSPRSSTLQGSAGCGDCTERGGGGGVAFAIRCRLVARRCADRQGARRRSGVGRS
jgi:hypothetical protein